MTIEINREEIEEACLAYLTERGIYPDSNTVLFNVDGKTIQQFTMTVELNRDNAEEEEEEEKPN